DAERRRRPRGLRRARPPLPRVPRRGRAQVSYLPYALAGWLFLIGLYGIVTSRHLVHLVVCLSVMQSSTYVFFLAVGYRTGSSPPRSGSTRSPRTRSRLGSPRPSPSSPCS